MNSNINIITEKLLSFFQNRFYDAASNTVLFYVYLVLLLFSLFVSLYLVSTPVDIGTRQRLNKLVTTLLSILTSRYVVIMTIISKISTLLSKSKDRSITFLLTVINKIRDFVQDLKNKKRITEEESESKNRETNKNNEDATIDDTIVYQQALSEQLKTLDDYLHLVIGIETIVIQNALQGNTVEFDKPTKSNIVLLVNRASENVKARFDQESWKKLSMKYGSEETLFNYIQDQILYNLIKASLVEGR